MNITELHTSGVFEFLSRASAPFMIITLIGAVALFSIFALAASRHALTDWACRTGMILTIVAVVALATGVVGSFVTAGDETEALEAESLQKLQTWAENDYGLKLGADQMEDLAGHMSSADKQPVTVEQPGGNAVSVVLDVDSKGDIRLMVSESELEPLETR